MTDDERVELDTESYLKRVRTGPCFVCRIVRDAPEDEHIVFRDDRHIAFLPNFQVQRGYVLVAPTAHREGVASDFSRKEYLELQAVVHRVALALEATVPTERVYVLSLGSRQGNAHVHWHVVALPPGVPYEDQQFRALMAEGGVLVLPDEERIKLADRLGQV